jgi:uncharacterized membrane protein YedE/YeeE
MKTMIVSFVSGLVFSVGLGLSGMTLPSKVLGFLDLAGAWDPSLALVMASALAVLFLVRKLAPPKPILAESFSVTSKRAIDARLVVGAGLFGIGWGLGGFCPGPGLVALGAGSKAALTFVLAMGAGMQLHRVFERWVPEAEAPGSDAKAGSTPSTGACG